MVRTEGVHRCGDSQEVSGKSGGREGKGASCVGQRRGSGHGRGVFGYELAGAGEGVQVADFGPVQVLSAATQGMLRRGSVFKEDSNSSQMLFFGSRCERLCMMQFSLISLIPGLIRNLQDCADPELDDYEKNLKKPTNVKSSDRNSLLSYMGLPLQIFGKGSLFGPYTPLQQLDVLADFGTKSYIVGSTNSLLLQQKDRYSDILINLDETTINITSSSLRSALNLSVADRRWIDFITQSVNDTWDENNPGRPKTMGYVGSEEFIRLQFEEYLLSLISSVKCHNYLKLHANNPSVMLPQVDGDPANDFGSDWIEYWTRSENYRIWESSTDSHLFDIVVPKHPCAGGLTIDDVQRRMMEQVKEYHLDERFATGKEVLGRNLAAGKEKASTVFNKLYSDMEALREAQRRRTEEARREAEKNGTLPSPGLQRTDTNGTKLSAQSVSSKAGAYLGSWGSWAAEKKKGWGRSTSNTQLSTATTKIESVPREKEVIRPRTQESFEEAIWDAELAAKHSVDGVITKIEIPMSPPPGGDGKRRSGFNESMDSPYAPPPPPRNVDEATATTRPVSTSTIGTVPDKERNSAVDATLPSKLEANTATIPPTLKTDDEAIVAKRKGDISDATDTPISP